MFFRRSVIRSIKRPRTRIRKSGGVTPPVLVRGNPARTARTAPRRPRESAIHPLRAAPSIAAGFSSAANHPASPSLANTSLAPEPLSRFSEGVASSQQGFIMLHKAFLPGLLLLQVSETLILAPSLSITHYTLFLPPAMMSKWRGLRGVGRAGPPGWPRGRRSTGRCPSWYPRLGR